MNFLPLNPGHPCYYSSLTRLFLIWDARKEGDYCLGHLGACFSRLQATYLP